MTAVTAQITDSVIHDSIVRAVESVFKTMIGREIIFVEKTNTPAATAADWTSQIFGNVGFVGDASGLIYLCLTEDFASDLTGRILGMSPAEVEMNGSEVVTDAIGEVTNMTVGGFKNTLCDLGHSCKLTLPTIVRGRNLSVAAIKSATRYVFHFDCAGQRLVADIQMKLE
jgi:chemotaxis protein CheX